MSIYKNRYSTKKISKILLSEIKKTLLNLKYGSLEIYVCNSQVTQITKRIIKKTKTCTNSLNKEK